LRGVITSCSHWGTPPRHRPAPVGHHRNVIADTFDDVTDGSVRWLVLLVRVPAEPSRHRVAVWRELRRAGAVLLGQGVWAVPDAPVFADGIARTIALAERGDGEVTVLTAAGRGEPDAARLEALFTDERVEEWNEFIADCAKFDAEIAKEIRIAKLTMAELEEEEHSLERLRRWHRDLTARDVFGAPSAGEADQQLKHCTERLADFTERVFAALHQM
jgi:flagellar biosynthesis regulator FlaF